MSFFFWNLITHFTMEMIFLYLPSLTIISTNPVAEMFIILEEIIRGHFYWSVPKTFVDDCSYSVHSTCNVVPSYLDIISIDVIWSLDTRNCRQDDTIVVNWQKHEQRSFIIFVARKYFTKSNTHVQTIKIVSYNYI